MEFARGILRAEAATGTRWWGSEVIHTRHCAHTPLRPRSEGGTIKNPGASVSKWNCPSCDEPVLPPWCFCLSLTEPGNLSKALQPQPAAGTNKELFLAFWVWARQLPSKVTLYLPDTLYLPAVCASASFYKRFLCMFVCLPFLVARQWLMAICGYYQRILKAERQS